MSLLAFCNRIQEAQTEKKENAKGLIQFSLEDFIQAIRKIDKPEDALPFFDGYIEYLQNFNHKGENSQLIEDLAKSNIGFCFGEGLSREQCKMWNEIKGIKHPYHDKIGLEDVTASELFDAGYAAGIALAGGPIKG